MPPESGSNFRASAAPRPAVAVDGTAVDVIQARKLEPRIMRIPPKRNRKDPICFSPYLYRARNLIERFFDRSAMSALRDPIRQTRGQLPGVHQARVNPRIGCALTSSRPSAPNYSCFLSLPPLAGTVVVMGQRFR
jgi:hypothetical protein